MDWAQYWNVNNVSSFHRLALEWIKRNGKIFGGDPENITLFGESAGAASAHFHALQDPEGQLVRQVILQSGNLFCPWAFSATASTATQAVKSVRLNLVSRLCQLLGCACLDELRHVEARHLVDASLKINAEGGGLYGRKTERTFTFLLSFYAISKNFIRKYSVLKRDIPYFSEIPLTIQGPSSVKITCDSNLLKMTQVGTKKYFKVSNFS